jgi:hypothetical protein
MSDNTEYAAPIPRAVREQAERAEQLARDIGMVNVPEDPNPEPDTNPEGTPQRPEGGAAVAPSDQPAQEGAGGTPPPAPEGGEGNQRSDDWEQRYRTLQGKYDRELAQARGQTQAVQQQVENLQQVIAAMQAAPPPAPAEAAAPQLTQEDRELWGDDLPVAVSRWAAEAVNPRIQQLEAENARLAGELGQLRGGQQQQSEVLARNSFESQLDMDPDLANGVWRQLNLDQGFFDWLQIVEPYSGQIRHVLLGDAVRRGDALRAAQIFKMYIAEHTAPPAPTLTPHTARNGVPTAGRMRLEQLAAPGRAAAAGTNSGASPEKRMWTNREIGAFYRDVQRGVYRGREVDKIRVEEDIVAAGREGRVTQ